jgi:CRISPR/Cas system-associated protein Cas10 (large subunit of type III CRISPR-Cas system)
MTSRCCNAAVYVDEVDGGTYCTTCDREVDAKTGAELTEAERLTALCQRELKP